MINSIHVYHIESVSYDEYYKCHVLSMHFFKPGNIVHTFQISKFVEPNSRSGLNELEF